ncbi:hypothetical protein HUG15_19375 [Salicibibacter cibarius]|uniref:Lipoprotein n=1 Tax=Salicibibacter cibarius TaxID=2743000 RepID=A0A7T6Z655_9BACI|nr:hypothetical protein [Salicibibacter cibarius]QQK77528.1 hypothetical protein HUG15_19375 [Salicibibacter cibarius]
MKKYYAIVSVVMLVACSADDVNESSNVDEGSITENGEENVETENIVEDDSSEENENMGESGQPFFENHRDEMSELSVVEEEIGMEFDEVDIQNDQGGSRVILYENDGIPEYKSIYIQNDQRLKIINLNDQDEENGLIYQEII